MVKDDNDHNYDDNYNKIFDDKNYWNDLNDNEYDSGQRWKGAVSDC